MNKEKEDFTDAAIYGKAQPSIKIEGRLKCEPRVILTVLSEDSHIVRTASKEFNKEKETDE